MPCIVFAVTVVEAEPAQLDAVPQAAALQSPAAADTAVPAAAIPQPEVPKFTTVKQLRLRSAAAYLPHINKESYGGEDAHFISNISGGAIGVADGKSTTDNADYVSCVTTCFQQPYPALTHAVRKMQESLKCS